MKGLFILRSNYIFKLLFVLTIFFTVWIALAHLLIKDEEIKSRDNSKFEEIKHELEAISVGYSHMRAIHFNSLGLKGMHFFKGGGDIMDGVSKAHSLLEKLPRLKYVFIPISEGGLFYNFKEIHTGQSAADNDSQKTGYTIQRFVNSPSKFMKSIISRDLLKLQAIRQHPLGILRSISKKIFSDCLSRKSDNPGEDGIKDGYSYVVNSSECLSYTATRTAHIFSVYYSKTNDPQSNIIETVEALSELSVTLAERGVRLVLVQTPVTPEFRKKMARFNNLDYIYESEVLQEHSSIINAESFFDRSLLDNKNDYFFDGNHIALSGAILFSKYLRNELMKVSKNE